LLWTAPELLRIARSARPSEGTFSADVFSYAIVVYELCFLKQPYGEQLTELGAPGNAAFQLVNQHELAMAPHIQSSGAPEIQ